MALALPAWQDWAAARARLAALPVIAEGLVKLRPRSPDDPDPELTPGLAVLELMGL